ncbi:unnamed protein product [Oppiella nova]|uniref:MANSC domain-containing protein n=1 Tax=Oppiella nova TaxID=334625 RepID=A0A7R9QSD9_9ACAR|nr:unnamed protein product [Oppiella nova]CAG2173258.1 unnamed protein product [Oppiella nova]
MNRLINCELNAIILLIVYVFSAYGLHSITKRYQIPDPKNGPQQQRSIRDSIVDRFHINVNTIIRTHDSRALGAKYLNETELPSNEDCLYWCLDTNSCNLAVYEQKTRGSCYLFDCGPNEDFRCKFTAHNFYSSSILQANTHPYELNEWQSQVKHEKELTKLRAQGTVSPVVSSSTSSVRNLMAPSVVPTTTANALLYHKTSRCLHYQFECKNNSECIAIYNVCDGIPQCSDGSDEAVDLECHKSRFNVPNSKPNRPMSSTDNSGQTLNKPLEMKDLTQKPDKSGSAYVRIPVTKSQQGLSAYNYPKTPDSDNARPIDDQIGAPKKHNFGPAEQNSQYRGPWNQYYQPNDGFGSSDNRMSGSGYAMEPQYQNSYNNRESSNSGSYWPSIGRQQSYDLADQMLSPGSQSYGNSMSNKPQTNAEDEWSQSGSNANTYNSNYYEHISRTRANKPEMKGNQILSNNKFSNTKQMESDSGVKTKPNPSPHQYEHQLKSNKVDESSKSALYTKPKPNYSHISSNKGYVNSASIVAVSYMHDSSQQSGRETNSAVIALSLGLCVTALLIVLVGCRMKSFKRKIARRGGRSLAHDADYLVNDLYLKNMSSNSGNKSNCSNSPKEQNYTPIGGTQTVMNEDQTQFNANVTANAPLSNPGQPVTNNARTGNNLR